ncbi:ABC transporter substrate-binding protein [Paenibacillus terreus]|uniref:ABC transporter substrate-binding protein n=1 Tax=Paenibacillus terreus TaxID=1387834 RepID=A0ABV5BEG5_9BACL
MSRKFKMLAIPIIVMIIISLMAACSTQDNNGSGNTTVGSNGTQGEGYEGALEPYKLTLAIPVYGAVPKDMEEVQAEINKITQAEINTTITILPISVGAWSQQLNLMISGGEKLDLFFTFGQSYGTDVAQGRLAALDEVLEKYGQGVVEAVGERNLEAARINGSLYGVPVTGVYGKRPEIALRKDMVEKYNIDVASINSLDDLESVFENIKKNEPNIYPLASGLASPLQYYRTYDRLGDSLGVLMGYDNGLKVENYYESAEYEELLNLMNEWYKKGFINKDAATTQSTPDALIKSGKAFSAMIVGEPGSDAVATRLMGHDMVVAPLMEETHKTTSDVLTGLYVIAQQSENPERAMMMLNLMYTNRELANLLVWGIEGKHYVKVSETQVTYPEGVDASNVGYQMQAWIMGNPLITYVSSTQSPDHWEQVKKWNEEAIESKALGFFFDATPVKNELTAINNVIERYQAILESGTVSPTDKLDEFRKALKAAGVDKYMAEKQRQLDEWAAANNK